MTTIKVSYFKTVIKDEDINNPSVVPINSIFKAIKEGRWKELIENIRTETNKSKVDWYKKQLSAVLFAGEFSARRIDGFVSSSNIINIDFDKIKTRQELEELRFFLKSDKHVYAVWESPSGKGLKALIKAPFDSYEEYKRSFCAIDNYFGQRENFDMSCSDISRACFVSYDPQIYINADSEQFTDKIHDWEDYLKMRRLSTPDETFKYLIKWMDKNGYSFREGNRNHYLYVLASAMCRYGVNENTTNGLFAPRFNDLDRREIKAVVESAYKRNEFGVVKIAIHNPDNDRQFYKKIEVPELDFDPASVIISASEIDEAVMRIANGSKTFQSFGLSAMDRYLVLKTNELYGFVAGSKAGKTLIMAYLSLLAAKNAGWSFLVLTTETEIAEYKSLMVSFYCNKYIKYCTQEQIEEALSFINSKFDFIENNLDQLQILDVYHYAISQGVHYEAIIIDPITNISKSSRIKSTSGNDYYEEMYVRYLKFSKQYCSLWIVAHTVTSKEREKTVPYVQDAEYGVQLARRCHYGITFFRDAYDEARKNVMECHVRYVRSALTRGGDSTLNDRPIEFTFTRTMDSFGYNISVDGLLYKNPLAGIPTQIITNIPPIQNPNIRIEKENDDMFEQREAEF